jgi:hypothetical protein
MTKFSYLDNLDLVQVKDEVKRIATNLIAYKKQLTDELIKLAGKVDEWDMKRLSTHIKKQAQETVVIADLQYLLLEANNVLTKKLEEEEVKNKPQYTSLKMFIETWKQKEVAWYQQKYDTGDRTKCNEEKMKLLEEGMDAVIKALTEDAHIRLLTLIYQLKSKVGEVTECKLSRNQKDGFDGIVVGTLGKVKIQTILAGGHTIQCYHYRTIIT